MALDVEVTENLYIYEEDHIVRTGLLLYYDPLLYSDLYSMSLSDLNTVNTALSGSVIEDYGISELNMSIFDLILNEGTGIAVGFGLLSESGDIIVTEIYYG